MKLRKYIRKYMTVFLLLCLVFTINVLPIGAVLASGGTTGSNGDYVPTSRSTFPLTIGFGYRVLPGDGYSPTLVMCNDFGGFGQEVQTAQRGQDYYSFKYPLIVGGSFDQTGQGVYYYDFDDSTYDYNVVSYSDGSFTSSYGFGYQQMALHNSAFFSDPYDPTLNFMNNRDDTQQCITFKARDVVYNTHYLYDLSGAWYTDPLKAMMPSMVMFNNDNMAGFEDDNSYYVYHYTWKVDFIDAFGVKHSYDGGWWHNTRDDPQKVMPIIPLNIMQRMASRGKSIIIDDFVGTLSATYYERPVSYILNGTWELKAPFDSAPLWSSHAGSFDTAACTVTSYRNNFVGTGLMHSVIDYTYFDSNTESSITSLGDFFTDGDWSDNMNWSAFSAFNNAFPNQYYSESRFTISDWDYANNANNYWYNLLSRSFNQVEKGEPDPSAGSANYIEKGLAGRGLDLIFYYPLQSGDNVVNTGSDVYKQYYRDFGFPYVAKYVAEYGSHQSDVVPPASDSLNMDFSSWIVEAVGGFVGFELWPGFSIASILSVCVAVPLVLWFLKMFAGG